MMRDRERLTEGVLFTDQYQLTMAQLYFRRGLHEMPVQFDHFFRAYPDYGTHQAGYCITAGLEWLLDWMAEARFGELELEALRAARGAAGEATFDADFLGWLGRQDGFSALTLRAVPEGRVVHPHTPLTVVEGPLALAQILETALLAQLNYPTLIATKASRMRDAGRGRPLLEFGMRRAAEFGANAGGRAALVGGADFTSNVGLSHVMGLEAKGTHAHSMVQVFLALGMSELEAFRAYAESYPDDCLLLVDTLDTLGSGVPNAIRVFEELRDRGHRPVGIRLDSGDLAYLAIQAAAALDAAGFDDVVIVLSSNLDELVIWQILTQIAYDAPSYGVDPQRLSERLVYGVGTRLITSAGDGALGGVYKLVSVCDGGEWRPAIKLSDSPDKIPNPGNKGVWRVYDRRGRATADLLTLEHERPDPNAPLSLHHLSGSKSRTLAAGEVTAVEALHQRVWSGGRLLERPPLEVLRARRDADLERLDPGVKRIVNPHIYHVSLSDDLKALKEDLIARLRSEGEPTG